jgi:2'-5' RNA ligase
MTGAHGTPATRRPTWRDVAAMPGRRLFVAVPLEEAAVQTVTELVERVRAGTDPDRRRRGRDVRWVRLDGLHLTLRFIGPTLEERVAAAVDALNEAAGSHAPFDLRIDGAGAFPDAARPRALWLGVPGGADELIHLAGRLDEALVRGGWPPSDRPFQPHLTLARSDGVPAGAEVARRLAEEASGLGLASRVDRIVLFESLTGGGPARYVPLETARLQGRVGEQ